jgi:hypothetical protein
MKDTIKEVITSMVTGFDEELFALSESELAAQWYFRWDNNASIATNIYHFSDMLELHRKRCRRWEEHHNGSCCVVERVRDKYLMPRVNAFAEELVHRMASEAAKEKGE